MANATLADLDDALLTALSALVAGPPTANAPFALAGRYAGPTTKRDLSNVCREQFPAVLLRFERDSDTVVILADSPSEAACPDLGPVRFHRDNPTEASDTVQEIGRASCRERVSSPV